MQMKKSFYKLGIVLIVLVAISGITNVQALDLGKDTIIQDFMTNPLPFSDHTRCEVIFALGRYWLFYDWVPEGNAPWDADIFVLYSADAEDWIGPFPVATTSDNEQSVRAIYREGQFYVTYNVEEFLYLKTSRNGQQYTESEKIYEFPSAGIPYPDPFASGVGFDILFAYGWYYLTYTDNDDESETHGEIFVTRSRDLFNWEPEVRLLENEPDFDYSPDLCCAYGRIWVAWDFDEPAQVWVTSFAPTNWDDPLITNLDEATLLTPQPNNEYWGPFSLIWTQGQFIFVTRTRGPDTGWKWRIALSTSSKGQDWTEFEYLTSLNPTESYNEKGPTVFRFYDTSCEYTYAIVFKRVTIDFQIRQVCFNL